MPTITFRGRILPDHPKITVPRLSPMRWTDPADGSVVQLTVSIAQSDIAAVYEITTYNPDDIHLLHIGALEHSRAIVDCICFSQGLGRTVMLDDVVYPDGEVRKLSYENTELAHLCTAFDLSTNAPSGDDFKAMYHLVVKEAELFLAINDLVMAITIPGHIAVNCARAVEGLRNIMLPDDPHRTLGWAYLRRELNLEKSYTEFITSASAGPRHGDRSDMADMAEEHTQEILKRLWVIMNRFLEYRKRGNDTLPLSLFPFLS
jgi:hypothetical protein